MSAVETGSASATGERGVGERLAGLLRRAGRDLAYLTIGGLTAILAFAVWVTAASVTISLLVFVVGLPIFLLSALAFRWTAELDRRNAELVLGRPLHGRYRDHGGERFLERLQSTATDSQTWRDFAWLAVHSLLGFAFGVAAVSAVAETIGVLLLPVWFWAIPGGADSGLWQVDNLGVALLTALASIPLAAIAVLLLRGMTIVELWLARRLLDADAPGASGAPGASEAPGPAAAASLGGLPAASLGGEPAAAGPPAPGSAADPDPLPPEAGLPLTAHATTTVLLAVVVTVIWGATDAGYFWPAWAFLGLLIPLGLHAGIRGALQLPPGKRAPGVIGVLLGMVIGITIAVWALTGFGTFWPIWPMLGAAIVFALYFLWSRVFPAGRERELSERVETLTRTRRGALDVQSAELRRIERDLHDGAQARLVALSMQLGRAEQGLADRPEAAELLRAARSEASAAIAELRDLARGIAPPVLADRGLPAAVEALGRRSAVQVVLESEMASRRPPAVIETAAYFVAAESLTNVAKHAPEATATVRLSGGDDALLVVVSDDGPGGADPGGGGLSGLRARVEALDGEMRVDSPRGGGTTIEVDLPCGS